MRDIKKLRNYILWFGNDIELASIIAKYLKQNNETVYHYLEATENKETSRQWWFWEYEEDREEWVRSHDSNTISRLPKNIFSRKAKLKKINRIAKKRSNVNE